MKLAWPVRGGPKRFPIQSDSEAHIGWGALPAIDIPAPEKTGLCAPWDSTVTLNTLLSDCGNTIDFEFTYSPTPHVSYYIKVRYCHLWRPSPIPQGSTVKRRQYVGRVGHTGQTFGEPPDHIHLAMWVDGVRVKPEDWYRV